MVVSLSDLPEAAAGLLAITGENPVIALEGPMGAGKTTFIAELCRQLQVRSVISSPTFSIINEYGSPHGPVFHLDLYRIKDEQEAIQAGAEEVLFSGNTCFVEWPSKAPGLFPDNTVWVRMSILDSTRRKISVMSYPVDPNM